MFLYVVLVLLLVAALAFMYMQWRERRVEYAELVREAAETETAFELRPRESEEIIEDEIEIP